MVKKKIFFLMVLAVICPLLSAGMVLAQSTSSHPIQLNWVSFVAANQVTCTAFKQAFIDRVNEKAKGELVFNYRGGPETIGAYDQGKAVQRGVVHMALVPASFYEPVAPGVAGLMLSRVTLEEERKPGAGYDYLVELHKKAGLFYLGRGTPSKEDFLYLMLVKKVTKPEDFPKIRIGTAAGARAAVKAWGAADVSVQMSEYYAAMERGTVDGIASAALSNWVGLGLHEVTKYALDHPYYKAPNACIVNLDTWNGLPAHLKTVMMETMIQAEKDNEQFYAEYAEKLKQKMVDSKVEFYKFAPDVARWFLDTAYNAAWQFQNERFPEVTPKLRDLLSK